MRYLKVIVLLTMFTALSVGVIHANELDGIPVFNDGRVNTWQMDEPVAVFCVFDHTNDVNVGVFQRIEVWGIDGSKLLEASAARIDAATGTTMLDSAWSYTLSELADDRFQVTAPNGYVFTWARGDTNC